MHLADKQVREKSYNEQGQEDELAAGAENI